MLIFILYYLLSKLEIEKRIICNFQMHTYSVYIIDTIHLIASLEMARAIHFVICKWKDNMFINS